MPKLKEKSRYLVRIGPAIIVGAIVLGPGSITTASSAGSTTGYSLIWLLIISAIFMTIYTDMSVRIGLASRQTTLSIIRHKYGLWLSVVTALSLTLTSFLFQVGSVVGAAIGLKLIFGGPIYIYISAVTVVCIMFLVTRNAYKYVEKLFIILVAAMVVIFAFTALRSNPNWLQVAQGVIPSASPDITVSSGLLGTSFSITAAFWATYTIREKGTTANQYKETTFSDTLPGSILPAIMLIFVMITAANILLPRGIAVGSASDMALAIEPTVGSAAFVLFGFGLFAAGITSVLGNAMMGGVLLAEVFGDSGRLSSRVSRIVTAVMVILPAAVGAVFGSSPTSMIVTAQALTIIAVPIALIVIFMLANNKELMGKLKNKLWQNILATIAGIFLIYNIVSLIISFVH